MDQGGQSRDQTRLSCGTLPPTRCASSFMCWPQASAPERVAAFYNHRGTASGSNARSLPCHGKYQRRAKALRHSAHCAPGARFLASAVTVTSSSLSPWFDCCDLLPSGESCLPVIGRFPVSHPPTCSARGFLPSRAGPARARARMRPPRLRQRTRSPSRPSPRAEPRASLEVG
jgi:hypothetical protein